MNGSMDATRTHPLARKRRPVPTDLSAVRPLLQIRGTYVVGNGVAEKVASGHQAIKNTKRTKVKVPERNPSGCRVRAWLNKGGHALLRPAGNDVLRRWPSGRRAIRRLKRRLQHSATDFGASDGRRAATSYWTFVAGQAVAPPNSTIRSRRVMLTVHDQTGLRPESECLRFFLLFACLRQSRPYTNARSGPLFRKYCLRCVP